MQAQYGAEKGARVFYATGTKTPTLGAKWHREAPTRPAPPAQPSRPLRKR